MKSFIVRQGQNLYDVALTLYGSIEGLFDLMICNPGLSFDEPPEKGTELFYHEGFCVNSDIRDYIAENIDKIANGNHYITIEHQENEHEQNLNRNIQ